VVRTRLLASYGFVALAATAVMLASHFEGWSASTRYLVAAGVLAALVPGLLVWISPRLASAASPIGRLASFESLGATVRRVLASGAGIFSAALVAAGVLAVLGHWQGSVVLVGIGSGFVLSALRAAYEELLTRRKTMLVRDTRGPHLGIHGLREPLQGWLARRDDRRLYNAEGDISRAVAEQLLGQLAVQLSGEHSLQLADRQVDVYEPVFAEWRQEVGVHDVFIFEIKWYDRDVLDDSVKRDVITYGVTADRASEMLLRLAHDLASGVSERERRSPRHDRFYVVVRHERDSRGAYRFVVALDWSQESSSSAPTEPLQSISDLLK
jgi:hypothetical protein